MTISEWYDHTTYPSQGAAGSSAAARAEFAAIQDGLSAKLPDVTGNGLEIVRVNSAGTALEASGSYVPLIGRATAQFNATANATVTAVPGMTVNVVVGKTYDFVVMLFLADGAGGGNRFALSGTATVSSYSQVGTYFFYGSTVETTTNTPFGTDTGQTTIANYVEVRGAFVCASSGTFIVKFAQNVSNVTTNSVLVGSTLTVRDIT